MDRARACEEKRERVGLSIAKNLNSSARENTFESSPQDGPQGAKLAEMTFFTGEFLLKALGKFMKADAALRRFSVCAQSH
jgi:hypothetical protein